MRAPATDITKLDRGERLHPSRFDRLYVTLTRLRLAFTDIVRTHVTGKGLESVVDYGCGNTPYRSLFESSVERYIACDLPGNPAADTELTPNGGLPLADDSVDVVLSSQVLEHVVDPGLYLSECRRVLRPDGVLILSTHGVWVFHPDPTDFWRWTSDGMKKIVTDAGFEISEMRGILGPPAYALQILQESMAAVLPRFARPPLFFVTQILVQIADWLCPRWARERDACIFIVVAK